MTMSGKAALSTLELTARRALMQLDMIHLLIGVTFGAVWLIVGRIVVQQH
jgi:hypothetical protein